MNKKEFLKELEERLIGISREDKKEILQDYEEHFKIGKKKKRSEENISKSLGEPKEIAKEIREELSDRGKGELQTEAIEAWVSLKKFSIQVFNAGREKTQEIYENFDSRKLSHWFLLIVGVIIFFTIIGFIGGGIIIFLILAGLVYFVISTMEKGKLKKRKSKKNSEKNDPLKLVLIILFNVLVFVWVWLILFFIMINLIVAGVAMIVAGFLLVVFSIFCLIYYSGGVLTNLLISGLFAGLGVSILGVLFILLFDKVNSLFFKFTKKYIKLNKKLIRK